MAELLAGKRLDYPPSRQTNVTHKKAPKYLAEVADHPTLPFGSATGETTDAPLDDADGEAGDDVPAPKASAKSTPPKATKAKRPKRKGR